MAMLARDVSFIHTYIHGLIYKEIDMMPFRVRFLALVALASTAMLAFSASQPEEPININSATAEELTELPRIGEVTAARIVEWREENGPFSSTEELMNVQGIGERVYERIRPFVIVEDSGRGEGPSRERSDH